MQNDSELPTRYVDILDGGADPDTARLIGDLETIYTAAVPDPASAALLRRVIEGRAATAPRPPTQGRRGRPWHRPLAGLATAAVLAGIAIIGIMSFSGSPRPVSAEAIYQRAQAAVTHSASAGISSYHLKATSTAPSKVSQGSRDTITQETWYAGDGRVRMETQEKSASGTVISASGFVSNGTQWWDYTVDEGQVRVQVKNVSKPMMSGLDMKLSPNRGVTGLSDLLTQYDNRCTRATLNQQGETAVAGRAVYVITVTLAGTCPSKPGRPPIGRSVVSVDKQTFFPLKSETFSTDGALLSSYEVTSIEYNVAIPDSVFTYTPPPGAIVTTGSSEKPAPTGTPVAGP